MQNRRLQGSGEPDCWGVERMVMHDVISDFPDGCIDGSKRFFRNQAAGTSLRVDTVQSISERCRVDPCVDRRDARNLRSRGRVDVDLMASRLQAPGEIGDDGLRAAALRLANRGH